MLSSSLYLAFADIVVSRYWFERSEVAKQLQRRNELNRKISTRDFCLETGGDESMWLKTFRAGELLIEMKTQVLDQKLCERQALRLKWAKGEEEKGHRRTFMKIFTTSSMGLNISNKSRGGKRNPKDQQNFRAALLEVSKANHPDPRSDTFWCPITSRYYTSDNLVAAYVFGYHLGQEAMDAIFGTMCTPELFSPHNGILMSPQTEKMFDAGHIVIVPRLPVDASPAQIQFWHCTQPKDYKIRVLNPGAKGMNKYIEDTQILWKDIDEKVVTFRSDFRPRARYLYYHYCAAMLKKSWNNDGPAKALRDELGKPYWGTRGEYMSRSMLMAFVEEMGHDYDDLLNGAADSNETEVVETALAAANNQIKLAIAGKDALSYDVGDSDDDGTDDDGDTDNDDDFYDSEEDDENKKVF